MTANVGSLDRALRVIAGVVLVSLVFVGPQTPWGWIGLVLIATGLLGFCPVYKLIGADTCGRSQA